MHLSTRKEQGTLARKFRKPTKPPPLNSVQKQVTSGGHKMKKSKSLVTDGRSGGEGINGKHIHPRRMEAV